MIRDIIMLAFLMLAGVVYVFYAKRVKGIAPERAQGKMAKWLATVIQKANGTPSTATQSVSAWSDVEDEIVAALDDIYQEFTTEIGEVRQQLERVTEELRTTLLSKFRDEVLEELREQVLHEIRVDLENELQNKIEQVGMQRNVVNTAAYEAEHATTQQDWSVATKKTSDRSVSPNDSLSNLPTLEPVQSEDSKSKPGEVTPQFGVNGAEPGPSGNDYFAILDLLYQGKSAHQIALALGVDEQKVQLVRDLLERPAQTPSN